MVGALYEPSATLSYARSTRSKPERAPKLDNQYLSRLRFLQKRAAQELSERGRALYVRLVVPREGYAARGLQVVCGLPVAWNLALTDEDEKWWPGAAEYSAEDRCALYELLRRQENAPESF